MAWALTREQSDAIQRLFYGRSQEYLDRVHENADSLRAFLAARGPPPIWYPLSDSDTEFSDADGAPMSPPPSPKEPRDENVLDLSEKAWVRRKWIDLSQGIEARDSGFNNYETWRNHMISEHAKRNLPSPASSQTPSASSRTPDASSRTPEASSGTPNMIMEDANMEDANMEDVIMEDVIMDTSSQPVLTTSKRLVFIKSYSRSSR